MWFVDTPHCRDLTPVTIACRRHRRWPAVAAATVSAVLVLTGGGAAAGPRTEKPRGAEPVTTTTTAADTGTSDPSSWVYKKLRRPDRVQVFDGQDEPVATFTVGARTVTVRGPERVLAEPSTTAAYVRSTTWVRLLPRPFGGTVDKPWLVAALADASPDVLATASEYVTGAPTVTTPEGGVLSSDADYGPLLADGTREEGSDFNDYLGVAWTYGDRTDLPETRQAGALDCSGFVRMVLGYRFGVPMTLSPDGVALPRRSFEMLDKAPGVVTVRNSGTRPSSTAALAPGDLLFFDGSTDDGTRIDHVAVYLGPDNTGAPRFISSRKTVNGPTLGDVAGKSVLSGTGYYANAWRAARRL